jgi:hypothetical protein
MNKFTNLKKHQSNNFNVLSSTSSEFISQINMNKNYLFSKGGSNHTVEAFNAFNNNNIDLALYILNNNNFNCNTQDINGNTILHHLVNNCTEHDKCVKLINRILQFPNIEDFIDIQNNYGQTPILVAVLNNNDEVAEILDDAGADKTIKDNDGNFVKHDEDSDKKVNKTNIVNIFNINPKNDDNTSDFMRKIKNDRSDLSSVLSEIPIFKKYKNNKMSDSSLIDITDTDNFINILKNKYTNDNNVSKTQNFQVSDTSVLPPFNIEVINNNNSNSETSPMNRSLNSDKQRLMNEPTSDSNKTITSSESINTEDLLKAIDEIQGKQTGGSKKSNKNKVMGYRNLVFNSDSDENSKNKISISNDYDLLYNSDSEFGNMNEELSIMMRTQKDQIHEKVLNMIMGLLDKGILEKDSVPIEATERNAKLIKAHIYKNISENNQQMGGLDKIVMFNKMTEQQIIEMVKDMPDLDKLEKEIQKHISDKQKSKPNKKSKNTDESEESEEPKKTSKKSTKESKTKKDSKKDSKKKSKK